MNWIDPDNGWETATELVEDTQAIARYGRNVTKMDALSLIHISEPTRLGMISYAVFCLKKKKTLNKKTRSTSCNYTDHISDHHNKLLLVHLILTTSN